MYNHGENPLQCEQCGEKFIRKRRYEQHMGAMHGSKSGASVQQKVGEGGVGVEQEGVERE